MTEISSKKKAKSAKKKARKQIALKLARALSDLRKTMGKKKFESSVKKASKLFSSPEKKIKKSKPNPAPKKQIPEVKNS